MSEFWGYPGADILAIVVIPLLCAICLYNARRFVDRI